MDPIIRAAAVAATTRQLRRQPDLAAAPPMAAAKPPTAVAPPPPAPPTSDERHLAALRERDVQIDALRAQAGKAQLALTDAYADAERRGFAAGEERGERAAQELLQAKVDRAKALAFQIGQARGQAMADAEDILVDIAFTAVCRVLGEQGASRETVQRIVTAAASEAREREQLVLRLHPDDLALLRAGAPLADADVRLVGDASVTLGGCIADTGSGSLDMRFETQLGLLADTLRSVRASRHTEQDTL